MEVFDIETTLQLEKRMSVYKKLIYETSILVERFWVKLSKSEFTIIELQNLGVNIADNYLHLKVMFEEMMELS